MTFLNGYKVGVLLAAVVALLAYAIDISLDMSSSSSDVEDLKDAYGPLPRVDLGYAVYQPSSLDSKGQFYNFSNIRYAAPPVGSRRFQSPQPPLVNRSGFQGGIQGDECSQAIPTWARHLLQLPKYSADGSEDCLFLDVNVPKMVFEARATLSKGAPVLVWIYGGGYTAGSKWYFGSGAGLLASAQDPMIYVALNYRLGMFGFMSGPSYVSQGGVANLGLLDQRFALEWIQTHIALFGGDPNRVTVMGQSAGGGSVMHQITAYGGQRTSSPFSQAILQSPGFYPVTSNAVMEAKYDLVLQSANCTFAPQPLECLKSLPEKHLKDINHAVVDAAPYGQFMFGPVVDGVFTPALPGNLLSTGAYDHNLTLMIGQCYNEAGDIVERTTIDTNYFANLLHDFMPAATSEVRNIITKRLYPPPQEATTSQQIIAPGEKYPTYSIHFPYYTTWPSLIARFLSDGAYICLTNYLARAFQNQTYNYLISIPPGTHGVDTPYVFYTEPNPLVLNETLARMYQTYLTNFVIYGDPNGKGGSVGCWLPEMIRYEPKNMVTNLNLTSIGYLKDPAAKEECYWWQKGLYA